MIERIVNAEAAAARAPKPPEITLLDKYSLVTNDVDATGKVVDGSVEQTKAHHGQRGLRMLWSIRYTPSYAMTIAEETLEIPTSTGPMRCLISKPVEGGRFPGLLLFSEIFQITGPIRRTAAFLASHGYVVITPEIYHELEPAGTVIPYDQAGAETGNAHKIAKEISAYDSDARAALDYLKSRPDCTERIGVMGICIGGHLAFRAAMNPDVLAAACFYATDIHKGSLGKGMHDDSLARAGDIRGELLHIWGRQDPHVPLEGRLLVHARLEQARVNFQWIEVNGQHAFLRDEGPRHDAALASLCLSAVLELFHRKLR